MGLLVLCLGIALFVGAHAVPTCPATRTALIARFGEGPYKLAFSLASALGIALMAYGFGLFRATGWIELWTPPSWTRHIAVLLMLPAVILLVAAYLPGHIKRAAKHPMLAGVKLWALAHLIANGDLGSLVLFGSLLAWAVYDRIAVKRREAAAVPPPGPVNGWRNDAIAVGVGAAAYFALGWWFHPYLVGVPAFSGYSKLPIL